MSAMKAGEGEHVVYRIDEAGGTGTLEREKHYLGIDAISWFINKQSSWFSDRMASGTLDIGLAGGQEAYQVALGTFALKGGARRAPVFDRPVLPDRRYRGGVISLKASLIGKKNDTVLAGMLKSAGSASLDVVAGMVQTASLAGPAALLAAAGSSLVGGVKGVLNDNKGDREPFLDPTSGIDFTLRPEDFAGDEMHLLFHRGSPLDSSQLTVRTEGELRLPFLGGQVLEDGAWLLLRLRKRSQYSGVREWFDRARRLRLNVENLVQDVASGFTSKEAALTRLKPGPEGSKTLFDEFQELRTLIVNDGVLTEVEARASISTMQSVLVTARKSIRDSEDFESLVLGLREDLVNGRDSGTESLRAFRETFVQPMPERTAPEAIGPVPEGAIIEEAVAPDWTEVRALPETVTRIITGRGVN